MLYQSYKAKLDKRRRIFDCVWRFRTLILCGILLVLAATGAMLGVKGIVYAETIPQTAEYGQPLGATAKSVLGGTSFEYRTLGGGWQPGEPRGAGEYEVRAVSRTVVGTYRYGEVKTVQILPVAAEIGLKDGGLIYGEEPDFSADLKYGDRLKVEEYTLTRRGAKVEVFVDPAQVRVFSESGEDVTSSYRIAPCSLEAANLPRPITIQTPSLEFEYDGKPHSDANIQIVSELGLAAGETITGLSTSEITEAGSCKNSVTSLSIVDGEGNDVTDRYSIEYQSGTLTANKRKITVKTPSQEWVYDGEPHFAAGYQIEGTLAENQQRAALNVPEFTRAGVHKNEYKITVTAEGEDVTENYEITYDYGNVTIARRPATLTAREKSVEYNGEKQGFAAEDYSLTGEGENSGLAAGDSLKIVPSQKIFGAGEYENKPDYSVISRNGEDVTSNYDIAESLGKLIIQKRTITVTPASEQFVYDGKRHYYGLESVTVTPELCAGDELAFNGIVSGFTGIEAFLIVDEANEDGYTFDVQPNMDITNNTYGVSTQNYEIEFGLGKIVVLRRHATLTAGEKSVEYNGEKQGFAAEDYSLTGADENSGLCKGQTLEVEPFTATEANTYTNEVVNYAVKDEYGIDVTSNYVIKRNLGELTITPKELHVTTASFDDIIYDGKPHSAPSATAEGLVSGHRFKIEPVGTVPQIKEHGEPIENKFEFTWQVFEGSVEKTQNYYLSPENTQYGKIQIQQRKVHLSVNDLEVMYDGEPHSPSGYTVHEDNQDNQDYLPFVEGDHLNLVFASYTDAGDYTDIGIKEENGVKGYDTVYDSDGNDVTKNYNLVWDLDFTVIITPRPFSENITGFGWEYDDESHFKDIVDHISCRYPSGGIEGHNVTFEYKYAFRIITDKGTAYSACETAPVEAGEYAFWAEPTITDVNGNDVTKNYDIQYFGTGEPIITISKRKLKIETGDYSGVYDGQGHGSDDVDCDRLVEGHRLNITLPEFRDAMEYENKPTSFDILKGEDTVVTANYDITWVYGNILIIKRPILIATDSQSWEYDGAAHKNETYELKTDEVTPPGNRYPLAEGHNLSAVFGEYINAGTYPNDCTPTITDGAGGDVTKNYHIQYELGTIEITKRKLKITTPDGEWTYDAKPHYKEELLQCQNLVGGHEFSVIKFLSHTEITDAGETPNVLEFDWRVQSGDGINQTDNYQITETVNGLLKVNKRRFTAQTGGNEFVYDGMPHTLGEVKFEQAKDGEESGVISGHKFIFTPKEPLPSVTNVKDGTVQNKFDFDWQIFEGDRDVSNNYILDRTTYGNIFVTPREIVVQTGSSQTVYDAQPHSERSLYCYSAYKLVEGHYIGGLQNYPEFTEAGEHKNEIAQAEREKLKIFDAYGNDVTDNYKVVTWSFGTVTITPRPLKVKTSLAEGWVYDGKSHKEELKSSEIVVITDPDGQISGHKYSYEITCDPIDAGDYKLECEVTVRAADGADLTKNYEIVYDFGTVTVAKRAITVMTGGTEEPVVYDAKEHSVEKFEITSTNKLVEGHELKLTYKSFVNAGSYENIPGEEWQVSTADGADLTKNYEITFGYGTVEISKRPVTVRTQDVEWIYDGEPRLFSEGETLDIDYGDYPSLGHEFISFIKVYNAGEYLYDSDVGMILIIAESGVVTDNYEITYGSSGKITIAKRYVKIVTQSQTFVYDKNNPAASYSAGYTAEADPSDPEHSGLVEDHTVDGIQTVLHDVTDDKDQIKYVDNEISDMEIKCGGEDCTNNYDIFTEWGQLRVKLPVTVHLYTAEKQYDGTPLSLSEEDYYIVELPPDVKEKDVEIKFNSSITETGALGSEAIYEQSTWKVNCDGVNRVDFEHEDEVLKVTQRILKITTDSFEIAKGDEPFYAPLNSFRISFGTLLKGHKIEIDPSVTVLGVLMPDATSAENVLPEESVKIIDENGNDVTRYYSISVKCGTLTWSTE